MWYSGTPELGGTGFSREVANANIRLNRRLFRPDRTGGDVATVGTVQVGAKCHLLCACVVFSFRIVVARAFTLELYQRPGTHSVCVHRVCAVCTSGGRVHLYFQLMRCFGVIQIQCYRLGKEGATIDSAHILRFWISDQGQRDACLGKASVICCTVGLGSVSTHCSGVHYTQQSVSYTHLTLPTICSV